MEENSKPPKNPRRARIARRDLNSKETVTDLGEGLGNYEVDGDQITNGGDCGVPEVGMVFKSHEEVSKFYKQYARRIGFGVSVKRSSFTKDGHCLYLELMCCKGGRRRTEPKFRIRTTAKTNCEAMIRVKLWGDGMLHLELTNLDHNHAVSPSMARFLRCYKKLSGGSKKHAESNDGAVVEPDESCHEPVMEAGGLENLLFGDSECRNYVERGRLKLGEGDAEALRQYFTHMQARNSNFFNVVDLDEEGCVRNAFWADARSRAAYQYYGDVVSLDTTYLTSKYDMPLATFVGVNHHGQSVLLGCCLLSDETVETFIWLFKVWLACMSGHPPNAIITDHRTAIQSAVAEVFPGARHRLCLWQIMKKIPEKLGGLAEYREVNKALQKAVYESLRVDEFEEDWRKMTEEYGLQSNEWLESLYESRQYWVPVFLKDAFWAGMSTTQHSETVNAFFDGYVDSNTSLKQFVSKYEMALQSKYEKEAQADFETFHKRRHSVSKFYMEEQLSKVYTLNMFKKFQDEIEAIMYCHASLLNVDGPICTFEVKECVFLEDGKKTMNKDHGVLYNADESDIRCICGSFQFRGIPCRHALSVFKLQQVHEIPSRYILDRWRKDYKRLHALARSSDDVVANNRMDRYDYLSTRCLQLVEVGVISDKYQLALKLVREVEKFLLSDSTYEDTQPKIMPSETKTSKSNQHPSSTQCTTNGNQNVGKTVPSGINSNGNDEGRRGRQPQERNDSKVSLGASEFGNQNYVFQIAPAASHVDTQIGMQQSINLLGGVSPYALPLGDHFGVQVNHQHQIGNQSRPSIVYMFPGGLDPQTFGNRQGMQWIYQQTVQAAQNPKAPPGPKLGQVAQKTKMPPSRRAGQATKKSKGSPGRSAE